MGKIPEGLKRFLARKKKKPANPNLRAGTKQTQKNRNKELMEKRKREPLEEKFKMLKSVAKTGGRKERGKMAKGGRPGLYANIHAKRKSGRPMRKKGAKGAPTAANFRRAAQTVKSR